MRHWLIAMTALALLLLPGRALPAEITEVLDAADGDDPIDINIDIGFHSILNRAKITHEWSYLWTGNDRPDYNELRFSQQTYAMDYTVEIGLYHDLQLTVNIPWIINDKRKISWVGGVGTNNSTLFRPGLTIPAGTGTVPNALAVDPGSDFNSTTRKGIGDMTVGVKWAPFNDERDDTKSVWIFGLDYTIPSGGLANPQQIVGDKTGTVGMGQHVLTPFFLFSHRFKYLDPYAGLQGSIPIQTQPAHDKGFQMPYHGGFLVGMEIVPWENPDKHQKFAIDVRLTTEFYGEVESKGHDDQQGTVNELSDFLSGRTSVTDPAPDPTKRQLQATGEYTNFGLHLGFVFRAAEFVRFRFGVSLAHNTEHALTGADACVDKDGTGECREGSADIMNKYDVKAYDTVGQRIRVEETTIFTYWLTGMMTF